MARPGHFSKTIAKGPETTTWIWNLHADAHDFDSHTSDLEEISRKIFSAHFGQLSIIFLWLSGMYFHGARFSNYEAWLSDPTHIGPSAQVVWPIVGQEILNGDVGGGFRGIQITSGFFQIWRASGITSELQLYCTAIGALVFAALMLFAGWFHYHKAAPKLAWFQDVESMLNHHLAGLLGLGSLSWAGHQVHVSLPINQFLNAGVDPKEIPLPHEFILNRDLLAQLYPSFAEGATPFFTLNWSKYAEFLTFRGGLDPVTGGLWLTDIAHHHLAIAILFLIAGHMYRTNWGIGHGLKDILEAHKGPFTGQGHKGLYEILTTSWHAQLSLNLAMLGSLTIVVAHHMYSMPPYPYLATDYGTQLSLFTHHMWIGGFLIVGAAAHAAILCSRLIPDKANLGFRFPCDGPGRGGTCQVSAWDHVFLGLFWMYNAISASSQGLAQDPTTRRIWFGIATAHDFESHDDITEERSFTRKTYCSCNWDPHFGQPAVEAFTRGGALGPVNIAYSGVYQWCGLVTSTTEMETECFVVQKCGIPSQPSLVRTLRSKFFGLDRTFSSCRYSRSQRRICSMEYFLDVLPHPQGLGPLFTGQWNLYAQNPIQAVIYLVPPKERELPF
ncbi:hypothetical protein RDABS01_024631 [Bienertia sinuspersici]